MTSRGRLRLQRSLCYVGAFVAVALGVTSFVLPILVAGLVIGIGLLVLAARLTPKSTPGGRE